MKPTPPGVLRGFIGLVLLATAVGKLLDVPGFARILGSYQALPESFLLPLALAILLAELALSIWLFSGWRLTGAAFVSVAMHLTYAAWSAAGVLRGLKLSNCGCFGVFLARPLGWSTVIEDISMVGLSAWLLALSRR